jgi:hypothetical protein
MDRSKKDLQTQNAPEYFDDLDFIRHELILPYVESFGYVYEHGDSGDGRSIDEDGIATQLVLYNPTTGNRLFIDVSCRELLPKASKDGNDEYTRFLRMATPQGQA